MSYRTIVFILLLFSSVSAGMILYTKIAQDDAVEMAALDSARFYSDAISAFRSIYTSEVVNVAEQHGLYASHDYVERKTIPLPATLSILLGKKIGESGSGVTAELYSPYPFPWRKGIAGLKDVFSNEAWATLSKDPGQPYYRIIEQDGSSVLRYAVADRMREDCIGCHNDHPDSPRRDWKTGDVRGVLDISVPLDKVVARNENSLDITIVLYFILSLLGFVGIFLMSARHRSYAKELQYEVAMQTAQLEEEKLKAEKASQAKTEFLSRMSHELRTPMNAVLGFAQLNEAEATTESEKENCREILAAGNHLLRLIDEILDLERIESGKLRLDMVSLPVDEVIEEALIMVSPLVEKLDIQILGYDNTGCQVYADYRVLMQVLINLLSNAIKYNRSHGSVQVSVSREESGRVRISVRDTGIGLSGGQIEKLFQPFERVGAEYSGIDGVGIGLSITARLIEEMGGQIGVQSVPGEGSTFWIELASAADDKEP